RYRPGLTRAGGERVIQPARRRLPPLAAVGMIGLRGAAARTIRTPGVSPGPDQPDGRRLEEKGQNTPLPRKRGKAPVHAEKDQDTLPPPRAGRAGVGAASDRRARRSRVGLAPIPTFPASGGRRRCAARRATTRPPPPRAGEGRGGGRISSPRPQRARMLIPTSTMNSANTRLSAVPLMACARRVPSGAASTEASAIPIAAGRYT